MPYAIAQGTVEVPYVAVQTALYCLLTYFIIHFQVDAGTSHARQSRWLVKRLAHLHCCTLLLLVCVC